MPRSTIRTLWMSDNCDLAHSTCYRSQKLAALKESGKATIQNRVWLSWAELFRELGPQMLSP